MIFRKFYSLKSSRNPDDLMKHITGQHLQVHGLDFEIYHVKDELKIIPHAENDDSLRTIPITHLKFIKNGQGGSNIKMMCKPRKIDSGGPTLLAIFLMLALVGGITLFLRHDENYMLAAYILTGIGVVGGLLFYMRLHTGYYDYCKKIRDWVKSHS